MGPSNWTEQDGYRVKTTQFNNCTITICRPILPPEEYERREKELRRALQRYGQAVYREEKKRA